MDILKKSATSLAIALAIGSFSSIASAGDLYVVGTIGSTSATDSANSDLKNSVRSVGGTASDLSSGTGFKALLGYQFSDNFSLEGGYIDIGKLSTTIRAGGNSGNIDVKASGFNVAVLGMLPFNEQFSGFAKVGYTSAKVETSTTGFSNSETKTSSGYGVGLSYKLTESISIRGEWEKLYEEINMTSVSLKVRF